jgi:hypothetical protein
MFTWYNTPFFALICTAFVFLALQFIGGDHDLDSDFELDADFDVDVDGDLEVHGSFADILGFLNPDKVPMSLALMVLSFSWGAFGLLYNSIFKALGAIYLPWFFAVSFGLSALSALGTTRVGSRLLAGIFRDTSAASRPEDLVGCVGNVISGQVPAFSAKGLGRARVYNEHGVLLQVACVTHEGAEAPHKHSSIFVTGYDPNRRLYTVLAHESPAYYDYISGHLEEMKRFDSRLQQSLEYKKNAEPSKEN